MKPSVIFITFLFVFIPHTLFAQNNAPQTTPTPAPDLQQVTDEKEFKTILELLETKRQAIVDFSATFKQEKILLPFNEKEEATGTIHFKSPDKIKWSFLAPEKNTILVKGETGYIISDDLEQVQVFGLEETNQFDFLLAGFGRPIQNYFFDFNVKCFKGKKDGKQIYRFVLVPKSKENDISQVLKQFEITIDAQSLLLQSSKLTEISGDITYMYFSDTTINQQLDASVFDYKIPSEYQVMDYRE